ncbi:MAG: hypothetical protein HC796_02150 [Synechococcaceae cyanobacterium RL_1_2]|nr:hypothetical protein [Synechococcaceae cyanobacterium RL_1_2]
MGGGGNDPQALFNEYNNQRVGLQYNPQDTGDSRRNLVNWGIDAGIDIRKNKLEEITLQGRYPQAACLTGIKGTASYGVLVSPAGQIVNIRLIQGSGYPLLNERGLEQISNYGFPRKGGGESPYHVFVEFKPNTTVCKDTPLAPAIPDSPNTNDPGTVTIPATPINPDNSDNIVPDPIANPTKPNGGENNSSDTTPNTTPQNQNNRNPRPDNPGEPLPNPEPTTPSNSTSSPGGEGEAAPAPNLSGIQAETGKNQKPTGQSSSLPIPDAKIELEGLDNTDDSEAKPKD